MKKGKNVLQIQKLKSFYKNVKKSHLIRRTNDIITSKKFLNYLKILILVSLSLVIISILIANVFYYKPCENEDCFADFMRVCSRAEWTNEQDLVLRYRIKGIYRDKCSIDVLSLEGDTEGMKMNCQSELGKTYYPEENLSVCSGTLKNRIQ